LEKSWEIIFESSPQKTSLTVLMSKLRINFSKGVLSFSGDKSESHRIIQGNSIIKHASHPIIYWSDKLLLNLLTKDGRQIIQKDKDIFKKKTNDIDILESILYLKSFKQSFLME
jgi:hypothetical protein